MDVKPISPADVAGIVSKTIDNAVFTVVNRMVTQRVQDDGRIFIIESEVLEQLRQPNYAYLHRVSDERLLSFAAAYEDAKWEVAYEPERWEDTLNSGDGGLLPAHWLFKPRATD